MKSRIHILLYALLCIFIMLNRAKVWQDNIFKFDPSGYHLYLPAVFIYNDLQTLSFYPKLDNTYKIADVPFYGITTMPNGNRVNKYTLGVAIMEMPFFLLTHGYNVLTNKYPMDGYSLPYQVGMILATIFWSLAGLFLLRKFLIRYFSENITLATLICITLGTNLYFFTAFNHGGNHPFSFFLVAALLNLTDLWYSSFKLKYLYLAALILGMITITRVVDIIVLIIPVLWQVNSFETLKQRMQLFALQWKSLFIATGIFLAVVSIQLLYWKYTSGTWLFYSYGAEPFLWNDSRIIDGLFSYRKGWFVYTPMAFIAFLGFINLYKRDKRLIPAFLLFFAIVIYVTFAWWCWWYGGGFGCRPMVDFLPLLCLPLAALFNYVFQKKPIVRWLFSLMLVGIIALNLFQSYQYSLFIISDSRMTKEFYWRVFGTLDVSDADYKLQLDDRSYRKETGRIDRK